MPILSEKETDDYEYGIILPYHFAPAMAACYKNNKIKLIVPVPQVKFIILVQRDCQILPLRLQYKD